MGDELRPVPSDVYRTEGVLSFTSETNFLTLCTALTKCTTGLRLGSPDLLCVLGSFFSPFFWSSNSTRTLLQIIFDTSTVVACIVKYIDLIDISSSPGTIFVVVVEAYLPFESV